MEGVAVGGRAREAQARVLIVLCRYRWCGPSSDKVCPCPILRAFILGSHPTLAEMPEVIRRAGFIDMGM